MFGSRGGASSQTASVTDLTDIARGAGIQRAETLHERRQLDNMLDWLFSYEELGLLTVKVRIGELVGEGPNMDGMENKYSFVRNIERIEQKSILKGPKI